jgi:hypothetical protein
VVDFIQKDIDHIFSTFKWKKIELVFYK